MYTEIDNDLSQFWDVLVIGAGNAGLCAAITAAEAGCSVLVIEVAARDMRGDNARHTRNLRAMHDEPTDVLTDAYSLVGEGSVEQPVSPCRGAWRVIPL